MMQYIQVIALVMVVLVYFANKQWDKEKQKEDCIEEVVAEYCRLHNSGFSTGVHALIQSGMGLLKSNEEMQEVVSRIEKRGITKIRIYLKDFGKDMTTFFNHIKENKIELKDMNVEKICKEIYR